MATHHWAEESIDGRHVSVALRNGTRIDDCQLVSCRHGTIHTLWLFAAGEDLFVPCDDVLDLWPTRAAPGEVSLNRHVQVA